MDQLSQVLKNRLLYFDGGIGTFFQSLKLEEEDFRVDDFKDHKFHLKGNFDSLCLTNPDVVAKMHRAFAEAGCDILSTNTFNSTQISQADFGLEDRVKEMNRAAAQIARKVANEFKKERKVWVAGSIGPTNKTTSLSPDVNDPAFRATSFDELEGALIDDWPTIQHGAGLLEKEPASERQRD